MDTLPIVRCGHGKPVMTQNGEWFMVYLCARMIEGKYSILGRETAIDPIIRTADGWPIVNTDRKPSVMNRRPKLLPHLACDSLKPWQYRLEWVSLRSFYKDSILQDENGITIKSSRYPLSSIHVRNLCLRRQTHFNFAYSAVIKDLSLHSGQQTGLTCYYDENTYLIFHVICKESNHSLQVCEHIDQSDSTRFVHPLFLSHAQTDHNTNTKESTLRLIIETNGLSRSFSYEINTGPRVLLGTWNHVNYLCDEGLSKGKRFTGAMFVFFAYSCKKPFSVTFMDYSMSVIHPSLIC